MQHNFAGALLVLHYWPLLFRVLHTPASLAGVVAVGFQHLPCSVSCQPSPPTASIFGVSMGLLILSYLIMSYFILAFRCVQSCLSLPEICAVLWRRGLQKTCTYFILPFLCLRCVQSCAKGPAKDMYMSYLTSSLPEMCAVLANMRLKQQHSCYTSRGQQRQKWGHWDLRQTPHSKNKIPGTAAGANRGRIWVTGIDGKSQFSTIFPQFFAIGLGPP